MKTKKTAAQVVDDALLRYCLLPGEAPGFEGRYRMDPVFHQLTLLLAGMLADRTINLRGIQASAELAMKHYLEEKQRRTRSEDTD
jgi:hypothetical protein